MMQASPSDPPPAPLAAAEPGFALAAVVINAQPGLSLQAGLLQRVERCFARPRDAALVVLYEALAELDGIDDTLLDGDGAQALSVIARYLRVLHGRAELAGRSLDRCERHARRQGDGALMIRVLVERGSTWDSEIGLGRSLDYFAQALTLSRQLAAPERECAVLQNLGQRLADAGLHAQAERCIRLGLDLIRNVQGPVWDEMRMTALANLSWAALLRADFAAALGHIEQWFDLYNGATAIEPDPRHIANVYENRSLALLGLDRAHEALTSAYLAKKWAASSQSNYAECGADLAIGRVLAATPNRNDEGFNLILQTLERCRLEVPRHLYTALLTAAQVFQDAQQDDVALTYFHELYHLKRTLKTDVLGGLNEETGQWLADNPEAGLALGSITAERPDAIRIDDGTRQCLSNINRLLEEHAVAAERLDDTTGEHCYRVGRLASLLGEAVGLGPDACFLLDLAARLHDVGKLMVPDEIIMKPGRLTPAERQVMQQHTMAGWEILGKSRVPQMHVAQEIARHHHEWWDGSGYPDRLAGHAIPITARVSALADVFDALTHPRPYKDAWPIDQALEEIQRLRGTQFDPDITDTFVALIHRLLEENDNLDTLLAAEARRSAFINARDQIAWQLKGQDPSVSTYSIEGWQPAAYR